MRIDPLIEKRTPRLPAVLSWEIAEMAMLLPKEYQTLVTRDDDGLLVVISQQSDAYCLHCGKELYDDRVVLSPIRARLVAAELIRLAEEIEAMDA